MTSGETFLGAETVRVEISLREELRAVLASAGDYMNALDIFSKLQSALDKKVEAFIAQRVQQVQEHLAAAGMPSMPIMPMVEKAPGSGLNYDMVLTALRQLVKTGEVEEQPGDPAIPAFRLRLQ